ncbi:MAG TPA: hypothetical protein VFD58_16945, partial [Blastocatellia bacterium]|nr:hypothetical protein [Blastocatellia bacterium]
MFSRIVQSVLLITLISLSALAQTQAAPGAQEQTRKTSIIIDRQFVRFAAPGEALEWRLVVTDQQGEVIFDSGYFHGEALEWPLLNLKGEAIESGLYAYTLSTRA